MMVVLILCVLLLLSGLMLIGGIVWNGFTNPHRHVMTQAEAVDFALARPVQAGGFTSNRRSWWRTWFKGRAWGISFFDMMSFAELKHGVSAGEWRRSPRLQQFLMVTAGGATFICWVILLIGWLTRPVGLLVAVGLVAYVAVQLALGLRRAR